MKKLPKECIINGCEYKNRKMPEYAKIIIDKHLRIKGKYFRMVINKEFDATLSLRLNLEDRDRILRIKIKFINPHTNTLKRFSTILTGKFNKK